MTVTEAAAAEDLGGTVDTTQTTSHQDDEQDQYYNHARNGNDEPYGWYW